MKVMMGCAMKQVIIGMRRPEQAMALTYRDQPFLQGLAFCANVFFSADDHLTCDQLMKHLKTVQATLQEFIVAHKQTSHHHRSIRLQEMANPFGSVHLDSLQGLSRQPRTIWIIFTAHEDLRL